MAVSDATKVDLLTKKVLYGVSDTSPNKAPGEESIASPISVLSTQVWQKADLIPTLQAAAVTDIVESHIAGVFLVKDPTVPAGTAWLAVRNATAGINDNNRLRDFIPFTVAPSYEAKVYTGTPFASGNRLLPNTSGNEWIFDYTSGVLTFLNALPAGANAPLYLTGFRYIGPKGVGSSSTAPEAQFLTYITPSLIRNQFVTFTLPTGTPFVLQDVSVDFDAKVECHSSSQYSDPNPYGFIATSSHLKDDGSYVSNGVTYYGPRFITLMNTESPSSGVTHWKITNTGTVEAVITLHVTVLPY
jgi:hypothetical protein